MSEPDAKGMPISTEPVEGGAVMIDCSLPHDHPDRVLYRSLSNEEMSERSVWSVQGEQAARAFLRLARNKALSDTLHLDMVPLDEGQKAELENYRSALISLVVDDLPELPAIPGSIAEWL